MAVAKMLSLDFRLVVKNSIYPVQSCTDGAVVLMAHDAVAGSNARRGCCSCSPRKGQPRRTLLGCRIHSQILRIHIFLISKACGRKLRSCRPLHGFPVRRYTNRHPCRCRCSHGGSAGEGANIRIVYGIYIHIGIFVGSIEVSVLDFGRSSPCDGIEVYRTCQIDTHTAGSRYTAGSQLGNERMCGGAVHHDASLAFLCTAFAEFCPVRGEIQAFRVKEFSILRTGNFNRPGIGCF